MECKQIQEFAKWPSLIDRRKYLAQALGFDDHKPSTSTKLTCTDGIILDLLLHLIQFCLHTSFDATQTSAVSKIVKGTHEQSVRERLTPQNSFAYFKTLLLNSSIQRPPFSAGILSIEQVKVLTEHVIKTYFKCYRLYQYAFTERCTLSLTSTSQFTNGLELSPLLPSLSEALSQVEWDHELEKARKQEEEKEEQLKEKKQADEERARQEEIEAAYRAGIPDEVNVKVRAALEQQLPELRTHFEKKFIEREQALLAKVTSLQAR